ncbi:N-acetylmuramic acid 6-phosphate etherase [Pseudomonadota bacterium]|nr:N-acetylmuramic acid 6-phosphate etherase [Pseudomonadota bacterium]
MSTENRPPENLWVDKMSIDKATQVMLDNQEKSIWAIQKALPQINIVISKIYEKLKNNSKSRLIFAGAGSSARIGVQDAVELYPTFGWPKNRVGFMIAGGKEAITTSVEGAEDNIFDPHDIADEINLSSNDILIALAASGNTPFTRECLIQSNLKNSLSIAISNNKEGLILKEANHCIVLDTGYEIIAGSTRLKAATAQKICLNILSSMIMTKLGFVKNGLMTHFIPSNQKLKKRKIEVLKQIKKI